MRSLTLASIALTFSRTFCQDISGNPDIPLSSTYETIILAHVVSNKEKNSNVQLEDVVGQIDKFPEKLSRSFDNEIHSSIQFYNQKEYRKARTVLETAINSEPTNPFVLEPYARASYQIDKAASYAIYKRLVKNIDSAARGSEKNIVIDMWFREAYWKLGTLHMDNKEWKKGFFEINRFMLSIGEMKGQYIWEQALEYLTECAYNLYDDKMASYLAKRVLTYNPENKYAKEVLEKLNK